MLQPCRREDAAIVQAREVQHALIHCQRSAPTLTKYDYGADATRTACAERNKRKPEKERSFSFVASALRQTARG